jgi:lipopolysaccharide export system permease protein
MNKSSDVLYDPKMLSVRQLSKAMDSLQNKDAYFIQKTNTDVASYLKFMNYKDSSHLFNAKKKMAPLKSFDKIIPDSLINSIQLTSQNQFSSLIYNLTAISDIYKDNTKANTLHGIEWHRKFTLSFACFVLFLIGAPLGSIIRKGGLGTPLVLAIIFFVLFFLLNNFGEKLAKTGQWDLFYGMWMSSIILIPVGLFLTYKAMRDSQLFNQEFYYRLLQPIKVTLQKYFKK